VAADFTTRRAPLIEPDEDVLVRRVRGMPEPEPPRAERTLDCIPPALIDALTEMLDRRVAEALAHERAILIEGIGKAVAEHVEEVERRIGRKAEKMLNERIGELKTEVALLRASATGEITSLSDPIKRRTTG
jgi:hypothetical protein